MPAWPRTIVPARSSPPEFPGALQSWGHSGKGQGRAVNNAGRVWQEVYEPFDLQSAAGRAFVQVINEYWRESTIFDIQHYLQRTRLGLGGGAPLVNGAGQTGNVLNVDGATASVTGWLKQGDIVRLPSPTVMFDVRADVGTNGSGQAAIPISPPLFVGSSPADNAVVTITDPLYRARLFAEPQLPHAGATGWVVGLLLTFREQL